MQERRGDSPIYSEKRISEINELRTLIFGLELDEGIRLVVSLPGYESGAFAFVTKCDDKYCISIREIVKDKETGKAVPGGKEEWKYFESGESVWEFVSKILKRPLEAYYY